MLPRSRVLAIFLVGLGAIALTVGLLTPRFINADDRLPDSIEGWTVRMVDESAGQLKQYHADFRGFSTRSVTSVRLGVSRYSTTEQAELNLDTLLDAAVYSFRMDKLSGVLEGDATVAKVIGLPTETVGVAGQWIKFPAAAQPQAYGVYDPVLGKAVLANYVSKAPNYAGLEREVFVYKQVVPTTLVTEGFVGNGSSGSDGTGGTDGSAGAAGSLVAAGAVDGTNAANDLGVAGVEYSAEREFVVDRQTGMILDVREHTVYGSEEFTGAFTQDSVDAMVELAKSFPNAPARMLVCRIVAGVGGVALLLGIAGVFGAGERSRRRK